MITEIRKSFKSKSYRVVLWLTVAAVAGLFSLPELFKRSNGPWVVVVNGDEIGYNEYARKVAENEQRIRAFKDQYGQYADMLLKSMGMHINPRELALKSLMREALLAQTAGQVNIVLNSDYITRKLHDVGFVSHELADIVPAGIFNQQGELDERNLQAYLKHARISSDEFEHSLEQRLQNHFMKQLLNASAYIPSFEIKERFVQENAARSYSLLTFSFDDFLKEAQKSTPTEQELKAFYEQHNTQSKRYWVPEKRSGLVWKFDAKAYGVTVSDPEVLAYYNTHKKSKYLDQPAHVQVRRIVVAGDDAYAKIAILRDELLKSPAAFADKAKEYSADKETASKGGLMPFFKRGEKEASLERAAFLLKADGDISAIIPADNGFQIVQRVSKNMPTYKAVSVVEADIKKVLMRQKFNDQFSKDMKMVLEQSATNPQALEQFIAAKNGKKEIVAPLDKDEKQPAPALFKLSEKEVTFYVESEQGIAVQLTGITKRYLPELSSVKELVAKDWRTEKAAKSMSAQVKHAQAKAQKGTLASIKADFNAKFKSLEALTPKNIQALEKLKGEGIPVEQLFQLEKIGSVTSAESGNFAFVARLDEIEEVKKDAFDDQRAGVRQRLYQERMPLLNDSFVASLFRSATIKTNDSLTTVNEDYSV
jgi:hypothetical protein